MSAPATTPAAHPDSLAALRAQVDQLDEELLRILAVRRRLVAEMGVVKKTVGSPALDPHRETHLRTHWHRTAHALELPSSLVDAVFHAVIDASRAHVRGIVGG